MYSVNLSLLMSLCTTYLYRRLLEKFQLFERQQQEAQSGGGVEGEMEEVLTPDERGKVERVKRSIAK